jgi:hypothetical protein
MAKNFYANSHPGARKEVKRLIEGVNGGDRLAAVMLQERLGTVDGMFAFADITNRVFQNRYAEAPAIWNKFASRSVVSDFREVQYYSFNEDLSNFKTADKGVVRAPGTLPKVAEGEKYQAFSLGIEQALGFKPEKHGAQIGLTWEAFVNDPWNTVPRIPSILTRIAAKTVDAKALGALFTAADAQPHVAAMTVDNSPIGIATTANAPLSFDALSNAWAQLKNKKDVRGNAVTVESNYVLVVSPGLVPKAEAILAQNVLVRRTGVDANNYTESSVVPTFGAIEVVEAPLLSFFAGNETTWILAPAGGGTSLGDPAVLVTFLAGEESPEIRVSGLAGYTPNGNALPFTSGSFDTDTFDLRVRHVTGAGSVNPLPLLLSDGTGTA